MAVESSQQRCGCLSNLFDLSSSRNPGAIAVVYASGGVLLSGELCRRLRTDTDCDFRRVLRQPRSVVVPFFIPRRRGVYLLGLVLGCRQTRPSDSSGMIPVSLNPQETGKIWWEYDVGIPVIASAYVD
ncbi:hypothetical protein MLD38_023755 [Melastoma candidum]|uniref:Uncharacterized protein n=1 Tax=Melastoma candidum TaxID=119954 RepID=A0ACB9NT36_9MYRT|nr:hypothetical protein MLD38_023755 [Melastoma candidum]